MIKAWKILCCGWRYRDQYWLPVVMLCKNKQLKHNSACLKVSHFFWASTPDAIAINLTLVPVETWSTSEKHHFIYQKRILSLLQYLHQQLEQSTKKCSWVNFIHRFLHWLQYFRISPSASIHRNPFAFIHPSFPQ